MKVYYDSKIAKILTFLQHFKTIMLFGAVFTENKELNDCTMYHENVHCEQYQTLFTSGLAIALITMFTCFAFNCYGFWMAWLLLIPLLLFYAWYAIEYVVRFIKAFMRLRDFSSANNEAYMNVVFEREAYALQYEYIKPCKDRITANSFSFIKYYKK